MRILAVGWHRVALGEGFEESWNYCFEAVAEFSCGSTELQGDDEAHGVAFAAAGV